MVPETGVTRGKVASYRHDRLKVGRQWSYEPAVACGGGDPYATREWRARPWVLQGSTRPRGAESRVKCRGLWLNSGGYTARAVPKALARGLPKAPDEGVEPGDEGGKPKCFMPPAHVRVCSGPYPRALKRVPSGMMARSWSRSARCLITRWTGMATPPSTTWWCVSPTPESIGGGKALGGVETPGLGAGKRSRRRGNPPNEDRISAGSAGTERVSTEEAAKKRWREDP